MKTPTYYPLIHNEWVKTYRSMKVKNPYSQDTIAKVYLADDDFLDMAIESSQKGFQVARKLSGYERYEILTNLVRKLEENEDDFVFTIIHENGKPIRFAKSEVARAKLTFTWAAEEARRMNGEFLSLDVAPQTKGYFGIARRFPLGVILGITPFNFPLNLVAHKVAPAIASGNSIILKPASQTPISAIKLGKILLESGMPPGMVNILPATGKNAELLVKDGRIKKLSFTGSAKVGWYLKSICGKKKITLELGGNAGVIVEPDINYTNAIPRLVVGSFGFAGQTCISIQRIYVNKSIFNEFVQKFIDEMSANAFYGNPEEEKTMVGPMIDVDAAKRAQEWINEAVKKGAKLIAGGGRERNMLQPTVLTNTRQDMRAVCEEIFAPVIILESYTDFKEAIHLVNNSHYGLQAGVFTNDFEKIQYAYTNLDVGGVIINDYPTFRIDPMPYGGSKDSGMGREGLKYAIEEMTQIKLLAIKGNS